MNALVIDAVVDEPLALALPALRPMVGKHVELTVREAAVPAPTASRARRAWKLSEVIDDPIRRPDGVAPVSLDDMERAILDEATKRAGI